MFQTSIVHPQGDLHMQFYGISFMHPYKHSGQWQDVLYIKQIPTPNSSVYIHTYYICGQGSSVGIATELRAGRSGIESRWGRDFPPFLTGPWGPPSLLYNGYQVFPGGKVRPGHAADHSPHLLVPRSWNSRAIHLPTLWATPGL